MLQSAVVRKRAGPGFGCIGSANQVEDLYNGLGQLITEYQSHNGVVNTSTTPSVQYAYSFVTTSGGPNHSRLVSMTYPNGRVLNYNYNSGVDDRISRVSSISDSTGTLEAYSYLGLNTVVTRSHPQTGINQTYVIPGGNADGGDQYTGLDRFSRVVEERWLNPNTNTVTDDFLYTYDRDGNRLTSSNALDSALSQQFTYDNLNQLATFTQGSHTESWSLDAVGNWLSFTDNGSTQTRSFNNQNQLTSLSGATTPTYDANGNTLTDDNGTRYSYDAWNRIVQVVAGSQIENFSYDALGRRDTIQSNSNFALAEYFSSNWQVIEEDQQGAVQNQFVWSSVYVDGLVEQDAGSSRWYAQQDANWNVTAMVTSAGTVVNRFVYDPYGKGSVYDANWNLQGGIGNGTWFYFFQGGRFDAITGLYDFETREDSPSLGRWIEEDSMSYLGGDSNLYRFLHNSPISFTDPSGTSDLGPSTIIDCSPSGTTTTSCYTYDPTLRRYTDQCPPIVGLPFVPKDPIQRLYAALKASQDKLKTLAPGSDEWWDVYKEIQGLNALINQLLKPPPPPTPAFPGFLIIPDYLFGPWILPPRQIPET
jgi:RHS repeat-associated protein